MFYDYYHAFQTKPIFTSVSSPEGGPQHGAQGIIALTLIYLGYMAVAVGIE